MFKKTLMTAAAALAITVGATTISTPDANAGVSINLGFGGYDGFSVGGILDDVYINRYYYGYRW